MSLFEELKPTLKNKWLEYYQANQSWIERLTDKYKCSTKTPDGGSRPYSDFILGAVSALEPKLGELLFHFFLVADNRDRFIEVLGLNFDPEKELEKRAAKIAETEHAEIVPSPLNPNRNWDYPKQT